MMVLRPRTAPLSPRPVPPLCFWLSPPCPYPHPINTKYSGDRPSESQRRTVPSRSRRRRPCHYRAAAARRPLHSTWVRREAAFFRAANRTTRYRPSGPPAARTRSRPSSPWAWGAAWPGAAPLRISIQLRDRPWRPQLLARTSRAPLSRRWLCWAASQQLAELASALHDASCLPFARHSSLPPAA